MDRFKFRVWAKPFNRYLTLEDGSMLLESDSDLWLNIGDSEDELIEKCPNDYIVEQCTGLKDKNGKLIFEGDVGVYDRELDPSPFVVEWQQNACALGTRDIERGVLGDVLESVEIIGNIHTEN